VGDSPFLGLYLSLGRLSQRTVTLAYFPKTAASVAADDGERLRPIHLLGASGQFFIHPTTCQIGTKIAREENLDRFRSGIRCVHFHAMMTHGTNLRLLRFVDGERSRIDATWAWEDFLAALSSGT